MLIQVFAAPHEVLMLAMLTHMHMLADAYSFASADGN